MVARVKLTRVSDALEGSESGIKKDKTTGQFVKGHRAGGRAPGQQNKTTKAMKEALILAAEKVGSDGKGKDGLVGYLERLARREPRSFASLLGKLLPFQITGKDGMPLSVMFRTKEEVIKEMQDRGLPIPPSVFDQAAEVKRARQDANAQTRH